MRRAQVAAATGGVRAATVLSIVIGFGISSAQAQVWVEQGPAPKTGGQSVGIPNNPVEGAVERIIVNPDNPNNVLIGSVNGGVWRTTDALDASPIWTPTTDFLPSLSIGGLTFDEANSNVVYAGIGKYSAMASNGGARAGLFKSTDDGLTWAPVGGNAAFSTPGANISSVVANGSTVLVTVDAANSGGYNTMGLWRSTDGGNSFTHLLWDSGPYVNLANRKGTVVVADPSNSNRYYMAVHDASSVADRGILMSNDGGLHWTQLHDTSPGGMDSVIGSTTGNIKLSVNNNGALFIAVANSGKCAGVFRTTDQGGNFTNFGIPQTVDGTAGNTVVNGIHPGGQAGYHFSLLADPTNNNVVYIGGDRQPLGSEINGLSAVGATQYSGRLFRSSGPGSWSPLTDNGTANGSGPHADSRVMAFDGNGAILEGDDGGLFRRSSPGNSTGIWTSPANVGASGLRLAEVHSVAYDNHGGVLIAGTQDNGSPMQSASGSLTWTEWASGGDGAVAGVYDRPGGNSFRYGSSQNLGSFKYRTYNSSGGQVGGSVYPALTVNGSGGLSIKQFEPAAFQEEDDAKAEVPNSGYDPAVQFYTKYGVNKVDAGRLVFGTKALYETSDHGQTLNVLGGISGSNTPNTTFTTAVGAIAYGGFKGTTGYADVLYTGEGSQLRIRPAGGGFNALPPIDTAYNTARGSSGFAIKDVVLDYTDWDHAFVGDSGNRIFYTLNAGASWTEIPGLSTLIGGELETLEFIEKGAITAVFAGGLNGVFWSENIGSGWSPWTEFGAATLPNAKVFDLDYDPYADVLAVGLLGRGAWMIADASDFLVPEPGTIALALSGCVGLGLWYLRRRK